MRTFLFFLAGLAALVSIAILVSAQSVLQEILGAIVFLVAVVAVGFGAVVGALENAPARGIAAPAAAPRVCEGCGQVGAQARVVVDGEQKDVCAACVAALREDASSAGRQSRDA